MVIRKNLSFPEETNRKIEEIQNHIINEDEEMLDFIKEKITYSGVICLAIEQMYKEIFKK